MLLLALVFATQGLAANLLCNSNLRFELPGLFKHCQESGDHCYYTEWSSWEYKGVFRTKNCTNKKAFKKVRSRVDYYKVCKNKTETKYTCKLLCGYIVL